MPNPAYLRGRRAEWALQKQLREAGFEALRTAGSHGKADLIVFVNSDDPLALMKPILLRELDDALDGFMEESDPGKILDGFLYGRKKFTGRWLKGEMRLHLTPFSGWLIQVKTKKG